jgi:hypothetical protein
MNRMAAVERLLDLLETEPLLTGVQVVYAWEEPPERDHIRVAAEVDGELTVPVIGSARIVYDDRFTITSYIMAATPGRAFREVGNWVNDTLVAAVKVVATHPGLEQNGAVLDDVVSVTLGRVRGPGADPTKEGALGWGSFAVDVHSRLT